MKIISNCPSCGGTLKAKKLSCPECGLDVTNNFELSAFDRLGDAETEFLIVFLKEQGNLKRVQEYYGISYLTAKKRLERVLVALHLTESKNAEVLDMSIFEKSTKTDSSEIIRNKLIEANGYAEVTTYDGTPYTIYMNKEGDGFTCDALRNITYKFCVFDYIVALLEREGGRAKKGQARGADNKVGSPKCNERTVTGVIALDYYGKSYGESVFDPVFILAAVLEWADIAKNGRGYLELTASYKRTLAQNN